MEEVHSHFTTVWIHFTHSGTRFIHLSAIVNAPRGRQYFTLLEVPQGYQNPQKGDQIRLEFRLERLPRNKRRTWTCTITGWPSLEREDVHDQTGYDS